MWGLACAWQRSSTSSEDTSISKPKQSAWFHPASSGKVFMLPSTMILIEELAIHGTSGVSRWISGPFAPKKWLAIDSAADKNKHRDDGSMVQLWYLKQKPFSLRCQGCTTYPSSIMSLAPSNLYFRTTGPAHEDKLQVELSKGNDFAVKPMTEWSARSQIW